MNILKTIIGIAVLVTVFVYTRQINENMKILTNLVMNQCVIYQKVGKIM